MIAYSDAITIYRDECNAACKILFHRLEIKMYKMCVYIHILYVCFRRGLYLSDVPLHDATRDLVLMSEQFEADYKLTRNLELLTDKLQQTYRELDGEKQKTDRYGTKHTHAALTACIIHQLLKNIVSSLRNYTFFFSFQCSDAAGRSLISHCVRDRCRTVH